MNVDGVRMPLAEQRDGPRQTTGTVAIQRHDSTEADPIDVQRWIRGHGGERRSDVTDSTAVGGGSPVVSDPWPIPGSELPD